MYEINYRKRLLMAIFFFNILAPILLCVFFVMRPFERKRVRLVSARFTALFDG